MFPRQTLNHNSRIVKKKANANMNTNSIPEFVDVGNGKIKIVLSNFTGELIARDIVGLTRYMDCPVPTTTSTTELNEPDGSKGPPFNDFDKSKNKVGGGDKERKNASSQPVEEGIDHPDQEDDDTTSVNLLEDSGGSDEDTADDKSTVCGGLAAQTAQQHGLNVSVANDDDIEYEPELSQQVCYWKY